MQRDELQAGVILTGPMFSEPVVVQQARWLSASVVQIVAVGRDTGTTFNRVVTATDLARLDATRVGEGFGGDAARFRLGVEALRLALAHEYDPFFSLSISRIDPLPHQLEAVYEYFLKLPRIRFLLADDPGAGKTVMAGLLLKELKFRGLVRRVLIITPANLTFQWQREMQDKFRERFEILRGDVLRANYGTNPFDENDQVVTSISWVSRIEDARESLLRTRWDLVIVDEAHKMAAYQKSPEHAPHKTLAYEIGERLRDLTDHYLLMTATPHKGDPENFCLFLQLLDADVYGTVTSLKEAMRLNRAPFYLRRTKEALVSFPDPVTGVCEKLYKPRHVRTVSFQLSDGEMSFYDALTSYVEEQSIRVADDDSPRGRAIGFTMAMLQRRQASSVYAVRRTLERMRERRKEILDDPEAWRKVQVARRLDRYDESTFEDLDEEDQDRIIQQVEAVVAAASDPRNLQADITALDALVTRARALEAMANEVKLTRLREVLEQHAIPRDPDARLLIFTEHKDTLDFLCGDGKEGRPVGKLVEWGVRTTQIHGGMKVGDRDTPGTRLHAERDFKERAQVMVATEAAGEGINLQFCWLMVNYDIPWSPVRLEQRMGRIHRYGQQHACFIFNFVTDNTREGRVLQKLLHRLEVIREQLDSDQVFDVIGEVVPGTLLESLFRRMYARQLDEAQVVERLDRAADLEHFKRITRSTLEGLARRSLNLSPLIERDTEARARRLVPEVVRDFFLHAAPLLGFYPKPDAVGLVYKVGRVPREVEAAGNAMEPRFGRIGRSYERITFHKGALAGSPDLEWVTPGHPLFEAVREVTRTLTETDLRRGASFYDVNAEAPYLLDLYEGSVVDGRGTVLGRRLFLLQTAPDCALSLHEPTLLLDLAAAPSDLPALPITDAPAEAREVFLIELGLMPYREEILRWRAQELDTVAAHVQVSMTDLIHRANHRLADLIDRQSLGGAGLEPHIHTEEHRVEELTARYQRRVEELRFEREIQVGTYRHLGRARVLPHPDRARPAIASMVRDAEIERIAVATAIAHERAQGWVVESVEADNRGFDLISRRPHPERLGEFVDARFIEVKGRSHGGDVALTANEYKTAERLRGDYWLYVVYDCASTPRLQAVRDPARLAWEAVTQVARYHLSADLLTQAT
jgi:superfamily II DNA or RNA helicase